MTLPTSFTFIAFIPGRGLRAITATLTSQNPEEAEVGDISLVAGETTMRKGERGDFTQAEDVAISEQAVDVLEWLVEGECLEQLVPRSSCRAGELEQRFEEAGAAYRHAEDFGAPDWHQHA